jgi:hypothetical protein
VFVEDLALVELDRATTARMRRRTPARMESPPLSTAGVNPLRPDS